MKFTAQDEYGLRCILQLARYELGATAKSDGATAELIPCLTIAEIASQEGLTPQYAGRFVTVLVKAGIVESVRGRKGGVRLSRRPEKISILEVLRALGGDLYQESTCDRYTGDRAFCVHTNDCSIRSLWAGLQLMINDVLSRTTLMDLCSSESTVSQWMKGHEEAYNNFHPIQSYGVTVRGDNA